MAGRWDRSACIVRGGSSPRRAASLQQPCPTILSDLDLDRMEPMVIDVLHRMRALGVHPACLRAAGGGVRGRGEGEPMALVVPVPRRAVHAHDTGVGVGVLGFAILRGYG